MKQQNDACVEQALVPTMEMYVMELSFVTTQLVQ